LGGSLEGISGFLSVNPDFDTDKLYEDILVLDISSEQFESEANLNRAMIALGERGLLEKFSTVIIGEHGEAVPWMNHYSGKEETIPQINIISDTISEYNPSATIYTDIPFGQKCTTSIPIGSEICINKS
jgi:muramoyltetrapeptide carboxypeptidase LdcA involved in peptidoglycan recycling